MKQIYTMYDKLCEALCTFVEKYPQFTEREGELHYLDMLAHTTKNVGKIIEQKMEMEEAESFAERGSYAGGSYAGRMSRRSFAGGSNGGASYKRDSMGRFSRGGGYAQRGDVRDELIRLMSKTNDDREIQAIEAAIEQIERQ